MASERHKTRLGPGGSAMALPPDALLCLIATFFDLPERGKMAQMNQRWRKCAFAPAAWTPQVINTKHPVRFWRQTIGVGRLPPRMELLESWNEHFEDLTWAMETWKTTLTNVNFSKLQFDFTMNEPFWTGLTNLKTLRGPGTMTRSDFIGNAPLNRLVLTSACQPFSHRTLKEIVMHSTPPHVFGNFPSVESLALVIDDVNELEKMEQNLTTTQFPSIIQLSVDTCPKRLNIYSQLQTLNVYFQFIGEHKLLGEALCRLWRPERFPKLRHFEISLQLPVPADLRWSTTDQDIRELQTWINSFPCLTHLRLRLEESKLEKRIELKNALSSSKSILPHVLENKKLPTLWTSKTVEKLERTFPPLPGIVLVLL